MTILQTINKFKNFKTFLSPEISTDYLKTFVDLLANVKEGDKQFYLSEFSQLCSKKQPELEPFIDFLTINLGVFNLTFEYHPLLSTGEIDFYGIKTLIDKDISKAIKQGFYYDEKNAIEDHNFKNHIYPVFNLTNNFLSFKEYVDKKLCASSKEELVSLIIGEFF